MPTRILVFLYTAWILQSYLEVFTSKYMAKTKMPFIWWTHFAAYVTAEQSIQIFM